MGVVSAARAVPQRRLRRVAGEAAPSAGTLGKRVGRLVCRRKRGDRCLASRKTVLPP